MWWVQEWFQYVFERIRVGWHESIDWSLVFQVFNKIWTDTLNTLIRDVYCIYAAHAVKCVQMKRRCEIICCRIRERNSIVNCVRRIFSPKEATTYIATNTKILRLWRSKPFSAPISFFKLIFFFVDLFFHRFTLDMRVRYVEKISVQIKDSKFTR